MIDPKKAGPPMQVHISVTSDNGVQIQTTYGPMQCSIILDPDDEDVVMSLLQDAFQEARKAHVHAH